MELSNAKFKVGDEVLVDGKLKTKIEKVELYREIDALPSILYYFLDEQRNMKCLLEMNCSNIYDKITLIKSKNGKN